MAGQYPTSLYAGLRNRKAFEDLESFCLFVGFSRSGHSLIGALLDAHPNVVISHELDPLRYTFARFSKWQIYSLILEGSQRYAKNLRQRGGYTYHVPGQWQGKFSDLRVIGDKEGEGTTTKLRLYPKLLERFCRTIGISVN